MPNAPQWEDTWAPLGHHDSATHQSQLEAWSHLTKRPLASDSVIDPREIANTPFPTEGRILALRFGRSQLRQQYMNRELPGVQAELRKGRGTRDQIANIRWIIKKATEFQKNTYFCFIDYAKVFDCVDHN